MFLIPARRAWAATLNLIGIVLVGLDLAQRSLRDAPAPISVAAWAAWSLWLVSIFLPEPWVRRRAVVYLGMIAGGSLAGASTDVVAFVPALVALLVLTGTPTIPLRVGAGAATGSVVLIGVSQLIDPEPRGAIIGVVSLLLFGVMGGLSRRQYRLSEEQSRALLEEKVLVEQERAQLAALTERSRIARDLHDVLAHSLGGLVIQLEAVDALLESDRPAEARDRVQAARKLAVSGLDEARRAVTALREPDEPLSAIVAALAATHRSLGGQIAVRGDADRGALSPAARTAVHRAVQELLTNARRHAPGAPTTLDLDWDDNLLTITASTPTGDAPGHVSPGGGHGLAGMRERIVEVGGAMDVRAGAAFDVVLRVPGKMGS
ncbi:signal transduction histidine kinase [Actinoplanes tereljensis]|uniref:histidine kinase n=1 Tax=Paractinoplanes tereljensis TaxID=571912 RepID=A0A919NPZ4_9ACTN|nr:histidine kinase [Actinoplanes tereljensis]GIF21737.1 two-component sensor histidine kinase [Actinoplanes tereljensis]